MIRRHSGGRSVQGGGRGGLAVGEKLATHGMRARAVADDGQEEGLRRPAHRREACRAFPLDLAVLRVVHPVLQACVSERQLDRHGVARPRLFLRAARGAQQRVVRA